MFAKISGLALTILYSFTVKQKKSKWKCKNFIKKRDKENLLGEQVIGISVVKGKLCLK